MSTAPAAQKIELEVPQAGDWKIDPAHSSVTALGRHLMVSKVRGSFKDFSGVLHIAENPLESTVEVTINAASIDTGIEQRDQHLKSADFLDVEKYPTLSFHGKGITQKSGTTFTLPGELTIRGVTRPVELDVEYNGLGPDPWGGRRVGFTATAEINREDFNMTWNQALETGGLLVGKKLKIELEVQAVKQ